ncbi:hypothetical protein KEM54_003704, partial [Ascosphaera aggregata]
MTTPPPEKNSAAEMEVISHQESDSSTNAFNKQHHDHDGGNTNTSSQLKQPEHQVETPASLTADPAYSNTTSSHSASSKPDAENFDSSKDTAGNTITSGSDVVNVTADAATSGSANSDTQSGQLNKQDTQAQTSETAKSTDATPDDPKQLSESAEKKESEEKKELEKEKEVEKNLEKTEKTEDTETIKTEEVKDDEDGKAETTTTQELNSKSEEPSAQLPLSSSDSHELPVRNASAQPESASKPEPLLQQSTSAAGPAADSALPTTQKEDHNEIEKLDKDGDTDMYDGEAFASSQPQPPSSLKRSADEMEADSNKQPQFEKQETPAAPISHDTEMTNADNLPPGTKSVREREGGEKNQASDEPAAKRAK